MPKVWRNKLLLSYWILTAAFHGGQGPERFHGPWGVVTGHGPSDPGDWVSLTLVPAEEASVLPAALALLTHRYSHVAQGRFSEPWPPGGHTTACVASTSPQVYWSCPQGPLWPAQRVGFRTVCAAAEEGALSREGKDWVAWTGESATALADTPSWGLPSQSDPEGQVWKFLPAPAVPAASWGRGNRVAFQLLPRQACHKSAQDSGIFL